MNPLLKELYFGNLCGGETACRDLPEYQKLNSVCIGLLEQMRESLSHEQFHLVDQLINADSDLNRLQEMEVFAHGFQMGVQFTKLILNDCK